MIDSYSFGQISIYGKIYNSDVIIFPDRVYDSWWRKEGHNLCLEDLEEIFVYSPEILIIGQGSPGYMQVPESVRLSIKSRGISLFVSGTENAVKEYNKTFGLKTAFAALHLTC